MDHHRHLRYALQVHGLKFDCSPKLQWNKPGNWDLPPAFQALLNFTRAHDKSTTRFFWRLIIKCHFCGDSVIWWNFNKITSVDCKLSKMVTNTQLNASLFWIHGERSNRACEIMEKTRGASDNFSWPDTGGCSLVFQERNGTQMSFVMTAEDKEMLVLRSKACSWTWQAQQGSPYLLHHPQRSQSSATLQQADSHWSCSSHPQAEAVSCSAIPAPKCSKGKVLGGHEAEVTKIQPPLHCFAVLHRLLSSPRCRARCEVEVSLLQALNNWGQANKRAGHKARSAEPPRYVKSIELFQRWTFFLRTLVK